MSLALASHADVLVENFAPGVAAQLGIDYDTLLARNPRLVYCSITAYGDDGAHADRPAVDALVAARTGHQWESRGVPGGTLARLAGVAPAFPDLVVPDDCWVAAPRPGPLFSGVPWVSMASAYLATLAISAALRVREQTGRGQRVSTSLFQGVLATTLSAWQRVEHADAPNYQSWISDPRAPKGVFRCADGRWIHQWVPLPDFVISAAEGDRPQRTEKTTRPRDATTRIGMDVNEMLLLHHYQPLMAAAIAKFPSEPWVELGAEVGVPLQPLRSPEEALHDPAFLDRRLRHRGRRPRARRRASGRARVRPARVPHRPPPPHRLQSGAHTDAVRAEADALSGATPAARTTTPAPASPLAGVRVLDLGLAVAGPWGTMMLADLGAEVIKVNPLHDVYWMSTHIAMACNRGKRSIAMNLKDPDGDGDPARAGRHRRRRAAQHALRRGGAPRASTTRACRRSSPTSSTATPAASSTARAEGLPGNDQTGAALAGPDWLDGGLDHDGIPLWPVVSLGDTGNGFLSAIGMVQALYHRDRTGEGQFVDTSIMYAQLLNASIAWSLADGSRHGDRPEPRRDAARSPRARTASTRPPTAGSASPRSTDEQRSALGVGRSASTRSATPPRSARWSRRSAPAARPQWFGEPRRRRGALRGVEPRLRPRPLRRSRDDREGLGHEVPPPDRRRHGAVRTALRLLRDAGRRAGTAARARSGHARASCTSSATTTTRIDELAEAKAILDWRP